MKNLKLILILFLLTQINFAQERKVSGAVVDKFGEPIAGVTIAVHKYKGTLTDIDGKYWLKVSAKDTMVFSYIGKKTQKMKADKEVVDVQLEDDDLLIEEEIPNLLPIRISIRSKESITITTKEITSTTSPKKYFKANARNNAYIIYVPSVTTLKDNELEFQRQYNITYLPFDPNYGGFFRKLNKLTFKHLTKKYNKSWQKEIRKDALGLANFIH